MTKLSKLKSKIAVLRAFTNSSSFVGNMRYDQDEQSITGILSGKHYKWCGVPERKFDSFEGAGSPGAFFNRELKAQYDCSGGGILSNLKSRTSKLRLAIQDVSEPFKRERLNKEPHKLHANSKQIEEHAATQLGVSPGFIGSHFLTTDGRLLGTGKSEHRSMSHQILKTYPDKEFNDMAAVADGKRMSRWGTDGRNMSRLLEQTGMSRVSADKTGINIDSKHPLTTSQRKTITQHLEDNNIGSDNVFIDDDTPSQSTIQKQLRLGKLKQRIATFKQDIKHKNEIADNVLNLSADSIMNKFIQFKKNNKEWKTLIGTFDPLQGNIIDARVPAGAMRLQNIFGAKGKLAFNSVTDTRQGPVTDMDLILSQLKEIEQAGGIPSLGVFEGSLEATKALIDMTDTEILNDLLESQRSTQIIDPDTRLRIVDNVSFRQN